MTVTAVKLVPQLPLSCVTLTVIGSSTVVVLVVTVEVLSGMGLNDVSGPMNLVLVMAGKCSVVVTNMVEVMARVTFSHVGSGGPYGSPPTMDPWQLW